MKSVYLFASIVLSSAFVLAACDKLPVDIAPTSDLQAVTVTPAALPPTATAPPTATPPPTLTTTTAPKPTVTAIPTQSPAAAATATTQPAATGLVNVTIATAAGVTQTLLLTGVEPAAIVAQSAYAAVIAAKSAAVLTEETAKQVTAGKLNGITLPAALIVIAAEVESARVAFGQPAPLPELQPVWDQGNTAVAGLSAVLTRWQAQQITAADIPGQMQAVNARIDAMLPAARQLLIEKYHLDGAQLDQRYQDAVNGLRANLQKLLSP
jgi:limonene-1,2-epoxide hydrolase